MTGVHLLVATVIVAAAAGLLAAPVNALDAPSVPGGPVPPPSDEVPVDGTWPSKWV